MLEVNLPQIKKTRFIRDLIYVPRFFCKILIYLIFWPVLFAILHIINYDYDSLWKLQYTNSNTNVTILIFYRKGDILFSISYNEFLSRLLKYCYNNTNTYITHIYSRLNTDLIGLSHGETLLDPKKKPF